MSGRKRHKKGRGSSMQGQCPWDCTDDRDRETSAHRPETSKQQDKESDSASFQNHRSRSASQRGNKRGNWRAGFNNYRGNNYNQQHNYSPRHTRYEKPNIWHNKRCEGVANSPSASTSSGSSVDDFEIPGFYYDKEKKKYFKILPGQHATKSVVTNETIKKKEAEAKRQINLQKIIAPVTLKKNHSAAKHSSETVDTACCSNIPRYKASTNIYDMIDSTQFGHLRKSQLESKLIQTNIAFMKPICHRKVFPNPADQYEKLEHMCQMIASQNENKLVGLWSLKDILMQRIQLLDMDSICPRASTSDYRMNMQTTGAAVLQSFSKVSNMCWAPMTEETVDPDQSILYTTTCFIGNNPSLAMLRKLNADNAAEFRHTEFSLGSHATWTCAWNRYSKQFSVGSEKCALLLDVQTRRLWELNTKHSDVLAQTFSNQGGNTLYNGTRKGHVLGHDMRSISTRPALSLKHNTSISHLYVTANSNYLIVADFGGKLKKWDLRKQSVVLEYKDQYNEYTRIPFHVDQHEKILYSAGQDCYTRIWDFSSGELLRTIAPPHPASRDTIPSLCYLEGTGLNTRSPGLVMGILDELHFYSL